MSTSFKNFGLPVGILQHLADFDPINHKYDFILNQNESSTLYFPTTEAIYFPELREWYETGTAVYNQQRGPGIIDISGVNKPFIFDSWVMINWPTNL